MNQHFYGSHVGHKIFSFKALREELAAAERRAEEERAAHSATKMVCSLKHILDSFFPIFRFSLHFFSSPHDGCFWLYLCFSSAL